jgi:DNA repair photolyase
MRKPRRREMPNAPPDRQTAGGRTQGAGDPAPVQAVMIPDEGQPAPGRAPETMGRTRITETRPKSIIGPANGFVGAYDGVINPYSGCSFSCDYCYASNFTHSEKEKQEWGQWVKVKTNALKLMAQIPRGALNGKTLYMATATDPYQPVERHTKLTRGLLEILAERHPQARIVIQTRSPLAARDTDVMALIAREGRVQVNMTVTTDDDRIRRNYEPGCPSTAARLKAIASINEAGIQSCITLTPLLPLGDAGAFARTLLETGVRRFILQPFHMESSEGGRKGGSMGRYIAQTDLRAVESTARHFGCGEAEAIRQYRENYRRDERTLTRLLPSPGIGRAGFAPPF